jgi:hypothetical protein
MNKCVVKTKGRAPGTPKLSHSPVRFIESLPRPGLLITQKRMAHGTSYVHYFTSIRQMSCALGKGLVIARSGRFPSRKSTMPQTTQKRIPDKVKSVR